MNPVTTVIPVKRWTLGPSASATVKAAPVPASVPASPVAPASPPKPDVVVSLAWDEAAQIANVTIPPYDPTRLNKLAEVRTYYLPSGHAAPADGPAWVASAYAFESSGDVSGVQGGATASLSVPAIGPLVSDPSGNYLLQTVLGHAE